jgi:rod shape-determining protein MreD
MLIDIIFTAACTLLAYWLQIAVLPAFGVTAVAPELILTALVCCAMFVRVGPVCVAAVMVGLLMDIQFGRGIGFYALPYLLSAWFAWFAGRRFNGENILLPIAVTAMVCVVQDIFSMLIIYIYGLSIHVSWAVLWRIGASAALSAASAALYYIGLAKWYLDPLRYRSYGRSFGD